MAGGEASLVDAEELLKVLTRQNRGESRGRHGR
jgi:hypothetical protein